jgi:hypothetical protein
MRFNFTKEQEEWREEVASFCRENITEEIYLKQLREGRSDDAEFVQKMADKKWIGMAWPKEYGGQGKGHMDMAIFNEELSYANAPLGGVGMSVNMLGASLIHFGTDDQKRKWLPMITSGKMGTSELVTEPEAGSDAANVQARAVADGDDFIITGTKIYNDGNLQPYAFATVRTDPNAPKHRGISLFVLDMQSEGITNTPLWCLGHMRRNMVIMEDVRVPRENLLGQLNRGWYHIAMLLDFERSNTGQVGMFRRLWKEFIEYVKARGLHNKPWVRQTLAELGREISVARLMQYRVASMQEQGLAPTVEPAKAKVWGGNLLVKLFNLMITIAGRYGLLRGLFGEQAYDYPKSEINEKWAALEGRMVMEYGNARFYTIGGGTDEIQKLVISRRGLELPR